MKKKQIIMTAMIMALAVLLAAASGFAQANAAGTIEGYVMENTDNLTAWMPVDQAEVVCQLRDGDVLVETDEAGFFSIGKIPQGRYVLKISKQGFRTQATKVIIQDNRTTEITISLKPLDKTKIGSLEGTIFEMDSLGEQQPVVDVSIMVTPISKNDFTNFLNNGRVLLSKENRALVQRIKTDEQGYYRVDNLQAGEYLVKTSKSGYQGISEKAVVAGEEITVLDLIIQSKNSLKPADAEDDAPIISGHVYRLNNGEKEAVSNITVLVSPYFPYPTFAPLPVYKAVTNDDGFYTFFDLSPGEYYIFVETDGYQRWEERIKIASGKPVSKDILLIPMTALSTLKGHVYDGSVNCEADENCVNAIIPGAEVMLYLNTPDSDATLPAKEFYTITDKSGIYYFLDVPFDDESEYALSVKAEGYQPWKEVITIEAGGNVREVYLKPLSSCIENSDCSSDMYCAKIPGDCNGKGICSPKPEVCPEVYLPVCGCDGNTYGTKCDAAAVGISVAYEGECRAPEETGTISGQVIDASDESKVIANADIVLSVSPYISSVPPSRFFVRTDEQGFYQIENLPSVSYEMFVKAEGYQKWEEEILITGGETLVKDIALTIMSNDLPILKGHVYDDSVRCITGERCIAPIAGAEISLFLTDSGVQGSLPNSGVQGSLVTVTDENGYYEFPDLPAGEYKCDIIVKAEGYNIWKEIVKIAPGENIRDINLMPIVTCSENSDCSEKNYCAKYTGNCEADDGICRPRPEICPTLYDPMCGCDGKTYGNDCEAAVSGVNVAYKGKCDAPDENGSLSGRVSDAQDGNPIVEASLTLIGLMMYSPSNEIETTTDNEGFYEFPDILSGQYRMIIKADGYLKWEGLLYIDSGEAAVKDVKLYPTSAHGTLKGNVYDGSVKCGEGEKCIMPIVGAEVTLFLTDSGVQGSLATVTDENGYYEFPDLPAGEYKCTMTVIAEGYQYWKEIIKIAPGENEQNVNLMPEWD